MSRTRSLSDIDIQMDKVIREVTFRILRYNGTGEPPTERDYTVPVKRGMTVLDGLLYIKENLDGSVSFRYSCRMGVCGSCGMIINGKPALACQTQILDLDRDVITLRPMDNYPNIKDLVPDLTNLFEKHRRIKPYIIRPDRQELDHPTREYAQSPEELEAFLQFTYCIKCGLCLSACPTVATDPQFIGPQALGQLARYMIDNRDANFDERCDLVDDVHGVWRCHFAGACTEVCPKGVDPALGAQLVKHYILKHHWFGMKKKVTQLIPETVSGTRREGIPESPPRTVESTT